MESLKERTQHSEHGEMSKSRKLRGIHCKNVLDKSYDIQDTRWLDDDCLQELLVHCWFFYVTLFELRNTFWNIQVLCVPCWMYILQSGSKELG